MARVRPGLNAKQQRFAGFLLGGMPASHAYREAGYTARTAAAAEANASRLIKTDRVAGYLAERRAVAAEKASLSLAGVLGDLVELAKDKAMDGPSRVAAFKLALEHLARAAPAAVVRQPAVEVAAESAFADRALAVVDALLGGELSTAQGMQLLGAIKAGTEMAHATTLADEMRGEHGGAAAPARPPAGPSVVPKWFQPAPLLRPQQPEPAG